MGKASEISELYREIKQQMGKLVSLCHEIEDKTEESDRAYAHGYTEAESEYRAKLDKIREEAYQKGLDDAWEAARKIAHRYLWDDYHRETESTSICAQDVLDYYSASEAIEKIRQYEQEQKQEEIEYGDEIQFCDGVKALVLDVDDEKLSVVTKRGFTDISMWKGNVTKTGEKYIMIADYLRKIRDGYEF